MRRNELGETKYESIDEDIQNQRYEESIKT